MLYYNISTTTIGAACFDKKETAQMRPTIVRPNEWARARHEQRRPGAGDRFCVEQSMPENERHERRDACLPEEHLALADSPAWADLPNPLPAFAMGEG